MQFSIIPRMHIEVEYYLSAEVLSVYSAAPDERTIYVYIYIQTRESFNRKEDILRKKEIHFSPEFVSMNVNTVLLRIGFQQKLF